MREGTLQFVCLLDGFFCARSIRFAGKEVDVDVDLRPHLRLILTLSAVRQLSRCMKLDQVSLKKVLVAERALAVLVWADEVAAAEMGDVVVSSQSFLLS